MFKTLFLISALALGLSACTDTEGVSLGEEASELTGYCFVGQTCRLVCLRGESGEPVCNQFCTPHLGPCGPDDGGGYGPDCDDTNDDDNAPDECHGGGSRFP